MLLRASSYPAIPRGISKLIRSIVKKIVKFGPLRHDGYTLSLYGVWLIDWWDDATFRFCANASYGFFYSDWIEEIDECIFIDIGANQGLYSLIAEKNPGITKIYAFEPQPDIFVKLMKNIERNEAERIEAFPYAISNVAEDREMQIKEGHSGAGTLRETSVPEEKFGHSIRITTVGGDFLDSSIKIAGNTKIAIKIDTEGHEAEVLTELMKSVLWDRVFNIFYEVDERYIDNVKILDSLKGYGFSIIYQNGKKPHYDLMLQRSLNY
jgi:FkbM family methyltransferase